MKHRASRWKKGVVVTAIGVALGVAGIAGTVLFKERSETVLKLGRYKITRNHLELYENDLRAQITSYFYNQYQADPNEDGFWERSFGGEVPKTMLRQKALDQLVCDTVERIEASEHGIDVDITRNEMEKSLKKINEARKDSDTIAYGPSEYGLEEYLSRTQMETEDALKEELLKEELIPSEEELRVLYQQNQALFDKGSKAVVGVCMYYGMKVGEYPEELKEIWDYVGTELNAGKDPASVVEETNRRFHTQIAYDEAEYDTSHLPRDSQEISWLVEQTQTMQAGDVSQVLDYGASQGVLKVLEKTDYGTYTFEESKTYLTNLWLQESYPAYIRKCAEKYGYSFES